MKNKNLILGVTGSIAAYKACDAVNALRKEDFSVTCVMTKEAEEFIPKMTLRTLSKNEVHCGMFEESPRWDPLHVSLADWADIILVAPATANLIGKLANGICDDLLTCVLFAAKAPVLIAPAMNERMFAHPAVSENIQKLKRIGYKFIGPVKGHLLCGKVGMGHIAPVEDIVREVKKMMR